MEKRIRTDWLVKRRWSRLAAVSRLVGMGVGLLPVVLKAALEGPMAVLSSPVWIVLACALPLALGWLAGTIVRGIGHRQAIKAEQRF